MDSDEALRRPTLGFRDWGIGLTPELMPSTILSLERSNKLHKRYLHGVVGKGGSVTCLFSKATVIVSRRDPDQLLPGEEERHGSVSGERPHPNAVELELTGSRGSRPPSRPSREARLRPVSPAAVSQTGPAWCSRGATEPGEEGRSAAFGALRGSSDAPSIVAFLGLRTRSGCFNACKSVGSVVAGPPPGFVDCAVDSRGLGREIEYLPNHARGSSLLVVNHLGPRPVEAAGRLRCGARGSG